MEHPHEWITVGARRWCLACDSFQVLRNGKWRDEYLNTYSPTQDVPHTERS